MIIGYNCRRLWMSGSRSGAQPIFRRSAIRISPSFALPATFSRSIQLEKHAGSEVRRLQEAGGCQMAVRRGVEFRVWVR